MVKLQILAKMENFQAENNNINIIDNVKQKFEELTDNPDFLFLEEAENVTAYESVTKILHDLSGCNQTRSTSKSKFLPKLLTDGFDEEQIWQQLELKSKNTLSTAKNDVFMLDFNDLLTPNDIYQKAVKETETRDETVHESTSDEYNEIGDVHENDALLSEEEFSDEDYDEDVKASAEKTDDKEAENIEDFSDDNSKEPSKMQKKPKSSKKRSPLEDQFFKFSSLEQFLRLEDLKEERIRDGELEESDDEENEIDFFQDIPSDDFDDEDFDSEDEDLEDDIKKKSSRDMMYDDFFDAPESGDENMEKSALNEEDNEEFDDADEDMADETRQEDNVQTKSIPVIEKKVSKTPFQLLQEQVDKEIAQYEESLVKKREWQLTGEVDASSRPAGALLDMETDFDMNAKPVIVQDRTLCDKLEESIIMTIKNKSYSDGVKQYKTDREAIAYKKEVVLEQTKSKKSLAQEYEDMYLKKQSGQKEEENPKHKEIKKLMGSLSAELYALFAHIPKPAIPEIKIVSNLPAITVEEVAPTAVSDVTLLAPEEVKRRTGLIKGKTERTDTDRKRERRKKKVHQKVMQKKREKDIAEGKPLSAKEKKREQLDVLKKLKQHRNTKIAKMDGEKIKSSKDFFERLQETVISKNNREEMKKTKKKRKT